MTAAMIPVFTLATEHKLPASPIKTEQVVGSFRLESTAGCERGSQVLSDYALAAEIGGGHAAQQSLIHSIAQAQADGCAVEVRGFHHNS